jgi:Na+-driven multidrug efflux pump
LLRGFVGAENANMIPAARTYVQIRALAWPAVLVGLVSQSASLGMQDSMGPLKSLAIASAVNLAGDIFLCTVMGYGIAGAAWATMASQVCHSVVFSQYSICCTLKFQSIFFEVFFLP